MAIGFAINSKGCYGCKTCQLSCENEHLQPSGVFMRRVRTHGADQTGQTVFVSMACNHCDDPQCMKVCPVGAYTKIEDGTVVQDHEKCIGCKSCIMACPFHAPSFDEEEGATYKCDGCLERRRAGLQPRCVESCPGSFIAFGETADIATAYDGAESVHDAVFTHPNLYVKHDDRIDLDTFNHIDGNTTEGDDSVDVGAVDGWLA